MIKEYSIHNFKNHADTRLFLPGITLLTGMNGAGKSSVMQSMLLLRDTYQSSRQLQTLYLKGNSFSVGRTIDAINPNCKSEPDVLRVEVGVDNKSKYVFSYQYRQPEANSLIAIGGTNYEEGELAEIPFFTDDFQYLSAFRDGPQSLYESDTDVVDVHKQVSYRMGRGEMAVYYLSKYGDLPLAIESLCHDSERPNTLRAQSVAWLDEIASGVDMRINQNGQTYELQFGFRQYGSTTKFYSASNTGFGITYILSVIVAVLSAKPGALILVENPEAHIHPAGQAALMRLFALASSAGVQIVIETHSDHILNGALVAGKRKIIAQDGLAVYFFCRDERGNSQPHHLQVSEDWRIEDAPDEFFGQMNADLEVLFDLSE